MCISMYGKGHDVMRKKLGSLVMVAAFAGLGYHLYSTHGTLEPCAMLQSEV